MKEKELIQNKGEHSINNSEKQVTNNIDGIFNSFIKHTIFKNKFVLQSNYTPENIPHREKQINQIAPVVAPSLRLERPSNLFIYGLTGTGKTLVIQYIKNQLFKKAKDQNVSVVMPFVNCKLRKVADTEYKSWQN